MKQPVLPPKVASDCAASSNHSENIPFAFGPEVCLEEFRRIQFRLCLDHFKWDQQVGDTSTLFRQPLFAQTATWNELRQLSEALTKELFAMERELMDRPELWTHLGLPRKLKHALKKARRLGHTKSAARTLRFDFHYTTEGWKISEVNSDVPGGYVEASTFTSMMASNFPDRSSTGNPADAWADALLADVENCRNVGLLSAPGFLEDQQVTLFLGSVLQKRGIRARLLHHPKQFQWKDGYATTIIGSTDVALDAIVRFYQGEWLARLNRRTGWQRFFAGGRTPVSNPGSAILTESKRLPLLFDLMRSKTTTWQRVLPACRDPREVDWANNDCWVIKSAFSNTGDSVHFRDFVPAREWEAITRRVRKFPEHWVVQRRFEPIRINSKVGLVYPCVGLYTINGKAAGTYARVSEKSIIDFSAMDAAFLIS